MTKDIQTQLDELKAKKNLTGNDRAKIKVLERDLKKALKKESEAEMQHEPVSVVNRGHVAARYSKELAKEVIAND